MRLVPSRPQEAARGRVRWLPYWGITHLCWSRLPVSHDLSVKYQRRIWDTKRLVMFVDDVSLLTQTLQEDNAQNFINPILMTRLFWNSFRSCLPEYELSNWAGEISSSGLTWDNFSEWCTHLEAYQLLFVLLPTSAWQHCGCFIQSDLLVRAVVFRTLRSFQELPEASFSLYAVISLIRKRQGTML